MHRRNFLRGLGASLALPFMEKVSSAEATKANLLPTPVDACQFAWEDLQALRMSPADKTLIRYVWVEDRSQAATVNFAMNAAASKAAAVVKAVLLTRGPLSLLRYNLSYAAPLDKDLSHLIAAWERLIFIEPYFHATITVPRFQTSDKLWHTQQIINAPYLGPAGKLLQDMTGSFTPIVRGDWLQISMLTTLNKRGRYYDFANIPEDFGNYLRTRGISETIINDLGSEDRVAINKSGISGTVRGVEMGQGSGVGLTRGGAVFGITYDPGRENTDPLADPLSTLLGIDRQDEDKYKAREMILEKKNGLHEWTLWNNKRKIQPSVPPDVATDDDQPAGNPRELQPGIGCIRCHGKHDGWQPLVNVVRNSQRKGNHNYYGQSTRKRSLRDTIGLIVDKYSGDLTKPLQDARDTYAAAVFQCTNGLTVPQISKMTGDIYEHYLLDLVTPKTAAHDIGFDVSNDDAAALLRELWPTPEVGEDSTAAYLKDDIGVNRFKWEAFYPDAMTRTLHTISMRRP